MVKSQSRDTMIFSLLDSEWPEIRSALIEWLSSNNFDQSGKAKLSLGDVRVSQKSCMSKLCAKVWF